MVKIGIVPLNWRYESSQMEAFLSRIFGYGFQGIQISGNQAQSPLFLSHMKSNGLAPAELYLAIRCTQDGPIEGSEAESAQTIREAVIAKVEMVVFAVDGSDDRDRCAGRADSGPQVSAEGFAKLATHIEKFARLAAKQGIRSAFHPHAATYVESERETAHLMGLLNPELVGLCLDVGHWIVGGGDPVKAVAHYGERITHVHVKDVSGEVLAKMLSGKIATMNAAVEEFKLFVPAGTGVLKLRELFQALEKVSFAGWLMSEQDSAWEPSEEASGISITNMKAALA